MVASLLAIAIIAFVTIYNVNSQGYSTNFSSFDSNHWTLATDCEHCTNHNGEECTQFAVDTITYNASYGAVMTPQSYQNHHDAVEFVNLDI